MTIWRYGQPEIKVRLNQDYCLEVNPQRLSIELLILHVNKKPENCLFLSGIGDVTKLLRLIKNVRNRTRTINLRTNQTLQVQKNQDLFVITNTSDRMINTVELDRIAFRKLCSKTEQIRTLLIHEALKCRDPEAYHALARERESQFEKPLH